MRNHLATATLHLHHWQGFPLVARSIGLFGWRHRDMFWDLQPDDNRVLARKWELKRTIGFLE